MIKKVATVLPILFLLLAGCNLHKNEASLYQKIFSNKDYLELYGKFSSEIRGTFAYITEDDIPELIVAEGDYEAARCAVYTIENNQIKYLGTFGSAGGVLSYCEKESYVESVYGNQGSFYNIFTSFEEGAAVVGDVFVLQRVDLTIKYYADFYPSGMTGDNSFNFLLYSVPEDCEVSEEKYNNRYEELKAMKGGEWKSVEYETMANLEELVGVAK